MNKHMYMILAACLTAGCISLHRDSTTAALHRTIIPKLSFHQAIAEDAVEFFQSAYAEFRNPGDPDLSFEIESHIKSVSIGDRMSDVRPSMRIGEGSTATAPLLEEMQRFAELADLVMVVEGQTIRFTRQNNEANQAVLPIAATAAQADR